MNELGVASRDLDPREFSALLGDPDLPFKQPIDDRLEGFADHDSRRDDDDGARAADPGHLQAIQSQEMDRSAPDLVPAFTGVAVVAGRAGPRQPRDPDSAEPRFPGARSTFKCDPLFWFLPRETYLITVKEVDAITLGTLCQGGSPESSARCPAFANPWHQRVRWPELVRSLARALALSSGPEGIEHPDQDQL